MAISVCKISKSMKSSGDSCENWKTSNSLFEMKTFNKIYSIFQKSPSRVTASRRKEKQREEREVREGVWEPSPWRCCLHPAGRKPMQGVTLLSRVE